jgi:formylglycine-generating enzyme required for sulfatase activity
MVRYRLFHSLGMAILILFSLACPVFPQTSSQPASPLASRDDVEMILIPAGQFLMGTREGEVSQLIAACEKGQVSYYKCEERYDAESPVYDVTIGAFYMDKTEVTNAQFERFIEATGYKTTAEREGRSAIFRQKDGKWVWEVRDDLNWRHPSGTGSTALPSHPVVHVSWADAVAYCRWAGGRLPTEAEWEYAARDTQHLTYPWGNRWDPTRTRHFGNRADGTIATVGFYASGASPFGVLDLAGNVSEWTSSLFRSYPYTPADGREDAAAAGKRTVRGGCWCGGATSARAAERDGNSPSLRSNTVGFRCARTP